MLIPSLTQRGRWSKRKNAEESGKRQKEATKCNDKTEIQSWIRVFPFSYSLLKNSAFHLGQNLVLNLGFHIFVPQPHITSPTLLVLHTKIRPSVRPIALPSQLEPYITVPHAWEPNYLKETNSLRRWHLTNDFFLKP